MRTLRVGCTGDDVRAWENFLLGTNPHCDVIVDGIFDAKTAEWTKALQRQFGITPDGVAGPKTVGLAMCQGFDPMSDDDNSEDGPNWPLPPTEGPLNYSQRLQLFGQFAYVAVPSTSNPEGIRITDGWDKTNIVMVDTPQLNTALRSTKLGKVPFNVKAAPQFQALLVAWESAGLIEKIKSFGGTYAPRYVRGSRTTLSNHSWGTAFDINVQWNYLGARPALKNSFGSVRELVQLANEHGFYWGGHFKGRSDGMHFEVNRII